MANRPHAIWSTNRPPVSSATVTAGAPERALTERKSEPMKSAVRSIEIDVPIDRVYALLVDFRSYPGFVPAQTRADVLEAGDGRWRVDFQLSVARKLDYILDLTGEAPKTLSWTLVEGDMMQKNHGGWTLEPIDDGKRTRATYRLAVELKGFVPRSVTQALVERTLPATLEAFKKEAERRHA